MSTHAKRERQLITDLLESAGPDAPTLCDGWTARDLAAHLVVRENRSDAAGGILIKPLAKRLDRVQAEYAAKPYEELLQLLREGPTGWSPYRLKQVDEVANTVEFFVHGEDVRRADPAGREPRETGAGLEDTLWRRLDRTAGVLSRKSPVGLVLRRPDGQTIVARKGAPVVTLTGEPSELTLFVWGRQAVAEVSAEGDEDLVAKVRSAPLGL